MADAIVPLVFVYAGRSRTDQWLLGRGEGAVCREALTRARVRAHARVRRSREPSHSPFAYTYWVGCLEPTVEFHYDLDPVRHPEMPLHWHPPATKAGRRLNRLRSKGRT